MSQPSFGNSSCAFCCAFFAISDAIDYFSMSLRVASGAQRNQVIGVLVSHSRIRQVVYLESLAILFPAPVLIYAAVQATDNLLGFAYNEWANMEPPGACNVRLITRSRPEQWPYFSIPSFFAKIGISNLSHHAARQISKTLASRSAKYTPTEDAASPRTFCGALLGWR